MSKEDVEVPALVPKKRRQLEAALGLWLAAWLDRDNLTPSERRRLTEEQERRAAAIPEHKLGVLIGPEGATPEQLAALSERIAKSNASEVHHAGVSSRLHSACRSLGVPVLVHRNDLRAVIKESQIVYAAVRDMNDHAGSLWEMVRYAKHRSVPVTVILANGEVKV